MAEATGALINQVAVMLVVMGVGCILFRMGLIDTEGTKQISNIVVYVTTPAVMLTSLMVDFDLDSLLDALFCLVLVTSITAVSFPLTRILLGKDEGVARYGAIFSNSGFIGVPLVQSVLGNEYVFYLCVGTSVLNVFIWTKGVALVSGKGQSLPLKQILLNPNIVVLAVGLVCFFLSVHPLGFTAGVLETLGNINTGLALLVLGCYLAQSDMRSIVTNALVYKVCAVRLVLIPALVVGTLAFFPQIPLNVRLTMILTLGAPVASLSAILAEKYGGDYRFGTGQVTVSTLLSVVTMPLLLAVAIALYSL